MKRKHKRYSKPKRPFDKERIDEEKKIKKEFGLKNKKEIWKADAKINAMREKAKKLISAPQDEQKAFFDRLGKIGLKVNSIGDVLALEKTDFLKRRLQTVLVSKNMARTSKSARQLITHKHVLIDGKIVNTPSYVVPVALENKISLKERKVKKPKEEAPKEEPGKEEKVEEKPEQEAPKKEKKEEVKPEEEKKE